MTTNVCNIKHDLKTIFTRTPVESYEAFLDYNGAPHKDDDPADYYEVSLRGTVVA